MTTALRKTGIGYVVFGEFEIRRREEGGTEVRARFALEEKGRRTG